MQRIEQQPKEIRLAYVLDELKRIVDRAETEQEAKGKCEQRFRELVEQGVMPNDVAEADPIKEQIKIKISEKFSIDERVLSYNKKATEYVIQGNHDEAVRMYQEILRLEPDDSDYYQMQLGFSYKVQGKYEEAVAAYQEAIRLRPTLPIFHGLLGKVYEAQGKRDEASEAFKKETKLRI